MADRLQWERVLKIEKRIRDGSFPSRSFLAEELEVTERTVQRDITFMKDRFGAPIASSRRDGGYFYTEPAWFLPSVPLTEGELFSLLIARQAVAQYRGTPVVQTLEKVFNKIAGALADTIDVHPDYAVGGILSFAPIAALPIDESVWNCLLKSARNRQSVRMEYSSRKSKETAARTVDPYRILNMQGDWYLYGYDHRRKKICQFQLYRIQSVKALDQPFTIDPEFDFDAPATWQSFWKGAAFIRSRKSRRKPTALKLAFRSARRETARSSTSSSGYSAWGVTWRSWIRNS
jgi:proteasome accessory factor B